MPDRTVAPAFRQIEHIIIKQPEKIEVCEGIDLYVLKAGTQPVIKLELVFEAGKWTSKKPGIAFFTGKMLREGAGPLKSFEISNLIESLGAHLEINPTLDFTFITLHSLEKYLKKILPLLKDMIGKPTFPENELETLKNIQVQTLRINLGKNSFLASRKIRESLFGKNHPYGHILEESDITAVTQKDIREHFNQTIFGKPFTIIASGMFGDSTVESIKDTFKIINTEPHPDFLNYEPDYNPSHVAIDKKDSTQSSIRLGCLSIPISHREYPGLLVINEIIGGYFGSRLMKNIREEKGLTYGIYSSLSTLKHGSFFTVSADVKKEFKEQAFNEIRNEIQRISRESVPFEELETVRNYMLGQIQASISTPFSLASKFKNVYLNNLGYEYYDNLIDVIRTITPEDILELSSKHLQVDEMIQVYVG